ncbi:MAG: DUF1292 domain-containing protein [Oscillospiraceae bacterium]|jgi:uncharacterized protein YrzB (UPF0473 family)|nr:DUF1292 domain-containing protein [Oscillospiraceae bacterium]
MADNSISDKYSNKNMLNEKKNSAPSPSPEAAADAKPATVPVIELFDEKGDKLNFELLDAIEYEGARYDMLTPYYDRPELYDDGPADVFVMKEVPAEDGAAFLESVDDETLLATVYDLFKQKHADEYDFKEKE